jgi:hypothetical protein
MKSKQPAKTDAKASSTTAAKLKDLPAKKDPKAGALRLKEEEKK